MCLRSSFWWFYLIFFIKSYLESFTILFSYIQFNYSDIKSSHLLQSFWKQLLKWIHWKVFSTEVIPSFIIKNLQSVYWGSLTIRLFLSTFLFSFQNVAAVAVETSITFPQVEQVKVDYNQYFLQCTILSFLISLVKEKPYFMFALWKIICHELFANIFLKFLQESKLTYYLLLAQSFPGESWSICCFGSCGQLGWCCCRRCRRYQGGEEGGRRGRGEWWWHGFWTVWLGNRKPALNKKCLKICFVNLIIWSDPVSSGDTHDLFARLTLNPLFAVFRFSKIPKLSKQCSWTTWQVVVS